VDWRDTAWLVGPPVVVLVIILTIRLAELGSNPAALASASKLIGIAALLYGFVRPYARRYRKTVVRQPPPASFIVLPRAFAVPAPAPTPYVSAKGSYPMGGGLVAYLIASSSGWFGGLTGLTLVAVMLAIAIPLVAISIGVTCLRRRIEPEENKPEWRFPIQLTPEGVASELGSRPRFVPWDALAPVAAMQIWGYLFDSLRLDIGRPELAPRSRPWQPRRRVTIRYADIAIDPMFLAAAIDHYVHHPERRPLIGDPEEHEQLRAELTARRNRQLPLEPSSALSPSAPPPMR